MSESSGRTQSDADDSAKPGETPAAAEPGLLADFGRFLLANKSWWLAPILLAILLIGLLVVLSDPGPEPFVYPQM